MILTFLCQFSQNYIETIYMQDVWLQDGEKFWGRRPLPQEAIEYAAEDVTVLVPELYKVLKR